MKMIRYSLIICFLSIAVPAFSQVNTGTLQKKVAIRTNSIRIDSLLNIFSKQTGIEFSFNSRKISSSKKINITPGTKALKDWLESLKERIGIKYSVLGNHIILTDYPPLTKKSPVVTNTPENSRNKPAADLKNVTSPQSQIKSASLTNSGSKRTPQLQVIDESNKHLPDSSTFSGGVVIPDSTPVKVNPPIYGVSMNNPRDTVHFIPVDSADRLPEELKPTKTTYAAEELASITKLDIGMQGIGVTFERRIASNTTIDFSLGIGAGYNIIRNGLGVWWRPHQPTAYIAITPKFYYNLDKRSSKGKTTELNSGNYLGVRVKFITRSISESSYARDALMMNLHWGMQRAISHRWSFNFHAGIGYITDATDLQNTEGNLYPAIDFKFSRCFTQRAQR